METAAASGGSLFFQALALRKRLGITSWIELILIGMTGYLITMYLATWIGLYAPMTSLIAIAGMSFSCYQIHLLGSLSERLEQFDKENKRLEESNKQLSESVSTFKEQNAKLKETTDELANENAKFKEEVSHLSETVSALETVKETIEAYGKEMKADFGEIIGNLNATLDEQKKVVKEQLVVLDRTKAATKSQSRVLLLTIHSQCQFLDQTGGLSPQEYQMFLSMVPEKYKRAGIVDFDELDADKDGTISVPEFQRLMDKLIDNMDSA